MRSLLAPEGRVFFSVPNARALRAMLSLRIFSQHLGFDERYRAFPIHLTYFDASTLTRLLHRESYRVELMFTMGLGIDQLLQRPLSPLRSQEDSRATFHARRWRALRSLVKAAILNTGLGEALCALCQPMPTRKS